MNCCDFNCNQGRNCPARIRIEPEKLSDEKMRGMIEDAYALEYERNAAPVECERFSLRWWVRGFLNLMAWFFVWSSMYGFYAAGTNFYAWWVQ